MRRQASALTNDLLADSPYTSAGRSSCGGVLGVSGRGVAIIAVVFAGIRPLLPPAPPPCRRQHKNRGRHNNSVLKKKTYSLGQAIDCCDSGLVPPPVFRGITTDWDIRLRCYSSPPSRKQKVFCWYVFTQYPPSALYS